MVDQSIKSKLHAQDQNRGKLWLSTWFFALSPHGTNISMVYSLLIVRVCVSMLIYMCHVCMCADTGEILEMAGPCITKKLS